MNIVEAFIKFNGSLIIIISGLSGSKKTSIAKFIERDFKLKLINIDDFIIPEFNETVILSNGLKIINWDSVDSYDWENINKTILKYQSDGVVLTGPYFPSDKLKFIPDFHVQIKIQKQILIENRIKFSEENKDKIKNDISTIPSIVNQITYPLYLKYTEKSKIDKFVNSKDLTKDQIYDQVADYLFFKINDNLEQKHKNNNNLNNLNNTDNKNNSKNVNSSDSSDSSETLDISNSSTDYIRNKNKNQNQNQNENKSDDSSSYEFTSEKLETKNSNENIFIGSDYDDVEVDGSQYFQIGNIDIHKDNK